MSGLHFGSYSLAAAPVADAIAALAARNRDRFISLDPNVRPTVEPDMDVWRERLAVLFPLADVVKISTEDLELLRPGISAETLAADLTAQGVRLVVVTDGGEAATGWTSGGLHATAKPPQGHGGRHRRRRRHLPGGAARPASGRRPAGRRRRWRSSTPTGLAAILGYAARAAAITCSRRGADLPRAAELTD